MTSSANTTMMKMSERIRSSKKKKTGVTVGVYACFLFGCKKSEVEREACHESGLRHRITRVDLVLLGKKIVAFEPEFERRSKLIVDGGVDQ